MAGTITLLVVTYLLAWIMATYNFSIYYRQRQLLRSSLGLQSGKKISVPWRINMINYLIRLGIKFSPVGGRLGILIKRDFLTRNLALAGNPYLLKADEFLGICFVLGILGLIFGNLLVLFGLPMASILRFVFLLAGLFGPVIWLKEAAKLHQEAIALELPNYLDAVSAALNAGVPLEAAMRYMAGQTEGPLGEELALLQKEVELGMPREEAYNRMSQRNNCLQLERLVYNLTQGSKLGVPVATTFRVLAEDMRQERVNRLKIKAGKAGPKVTLITSFVILPFVLLGIFGLLVLNLIYNPQGIGLQGWFIN